MTWDHKLQSDQKTAFLTESGIKQVTQRDCAVTSLEEAKKMTGGTSGQPTLGDPAWPGGLDQEILNGLF